MFCLCTPHYRQCPRIDNSISSHSSCPWVMVLWLHEELFNCSTDLEVSLYTILTTNLLKTFCYILCVRDDNKSITGSLPGGGTSSVLVLGLWVSCSALVLSLLELSWSMLTLGLELLSFRLLMLLLTSQLLLMYLHCTLLMAQCGYLHLTRASLRSCNSFWTSSGLVQTVLALWVSVPMTLYLADRLWWLSHCKYWSVWVGLQYTVMERELSAWGVTKVSRKGMAPSPWWPSTVNLNYQI